MKLKSCFFLLASLLTSVARGQGTFVYDQQSSDETKPGQAAAGIQVSQPMGQSFTPAFSAIDFIRLQLFDINPGNALGAMIVVNLRANSITGAVLAATSPVFLPDGFGDFNLVGFTNFFFPVSVALTPGLTYYFQPVVQSGDAWSIGRFIQGSDYPGGTIYINGQPGSDDLWFREGVVPEPSSALLVGLGVGLLVWRRRGPSYRRGLFACSLKKARSIAL